MMRLGLRLVLICVLALGDSALAHTVAGESGPLTLTPHDLLRYLHVVLLVFWLGPDVGILIAGSHAANPALNAAQRAGAGRMMQYYEIMPRVCMSLMLTVGGLLSEHVGLEHPWWQMAGIVVLGPVWLVLTLAAYFGRSDAGALAARLEHWLRIALIIGVPVSVTYSAVTGRLAEAPYVGGKLLLFALVLLLGLFARRAWAPFLQGIRDLAVVGASPALDQTMKASFARGRHFVIATWITLMLATLAGIVQPGVPEEQAEVASSGAEPPAAH